jgi:hypothetical protein
VARPVRKIEKLTACLLILAIFVSGIQCAAGSANAANATATPAPTQKPAGPAVNTTGSVTGMVFDAIGNVVPDADVYPHDGQGVATGLTGSDQNGSYSFTELDPGNYAIVVQVDGYAWYRQFAVAAGFKNVSDIHIPDYIHYPMVTPRPPVNVNNSTPSGSKNGGGAATPAPTLKPAVNTTAGNSSVSYGNATKPTSNSTSTSSTANETEEAGGGSPIDGIINGIVGFFQSLFGL